METEWKNRIVTFIQAAVPAPDVALRIESVWPHYLQSGTRRVFVVVPTTSTWAMFTAKYVGHNKIAGLPVIFDKIFTDYI